MKLIIKKHLFYYNVIDENRNIVCRVKSKNRGKSAKEIISTKDKTRYFTEIVDMEPPIESWNRAACRKYVAYCGDDKRTTFLSASLTYAKNDIRNKWQRLLLRRPQVNKIKVSSPIGDVEINRLKYNILEIRHESKKTGVINFHPFKSHYIHFDNINEPAFLTALYLLASYMVYEDNLLIN